MDPLRSRGNALSGLYSPLKRSNREIRLLEIVSSSPSDGSAAGAVAGVPTAMTSCRLHTVSLEANPQYVALSYVWGDATVTEDILVDGQVVAVTVNLASALRHAQGCWERLSQKSAGFRLWADAVCINQQDLDERASQVQLMRQIYESAEVTFAWLPSFVKNEEAAVISPAIALLNTAHNLAARYAMEPLRSTDTGVHWIDDLIALPRRVDWASFIPALLEVYPFSLSEGESDSASYEGYTVAEPWASLYRICILPYWNRVWVYQEALVSQVYYLVSPGEMIDSATARMAFVGLERVLGQTIPGVPVEQAAICAAYQNMLLSFGGNIASFLQTTRQLWYIGSSKTAADSTRSDKYWDAMTRSGLIRTVFGGDRLSTDPLDQVYGVLGYTGINVVPDYSASIDQVYLDFAHKVVYELGTSDMVEAGWDIKIGLSFLSECAAGIGNNLNLPTWAPAFYLSRLRNLNVFSVNYKPPARLKDVRRITTKDKSLWAPAARVQPVSRRRPAEPHRMPCQATADLFEEVLQSHGTVYRHGTGTMPMVEALCRVLMLKRGGPVDLQGLALVFFAQCGWGTEPPPSSILYKELEDSLEKFFETADVDTMQSPIGWFLSNWGYLQTDGFETLQVIETRDGYLGMAGEDARKGDIVYIIKGCPTPALLRPDGDRFLFVGPCFVLGLMEEEIIDLLESEQTTIDVVEIR